MHHRPLCVLTATKVATVELYGYIAPTLCEGQCVWVRVCVPRWGPLLVMDMNEEKRVLKDRLENWSEDRLMADGFMLQGLTARYEHTCPTHAHTHIRTHIYIHTYIHTHADTP